MIVGYAFEYCEITLSELAPPDRPDANDLCVVVAFRSPDFNGVVRNVWIDARAWQSFGDGLLGIVTQGKGQAEVRSLSPSDFWLRISARTATSEIAAEGYISRTHYVLGDAKENRLGFAFAFDRDGLYRLAPELNAFLPT